ncbi:uncharacterized protein BO95DRAFT_427063 [Aspergillus brunneoviolaceus CBS 621.78]|uniref:Uncharacterized protein n=1 Tax=Aspergillus brunneoviolaceus CBS 621.78 TaxID=1450534 RepID=A0ACD1GPN8_9EURO|nr:hypothetical protein BO95DRAFT_427063 [Aspergillus brunneoviolaceus CBS 621.78]RAH51249.1 hypothetical protein BO95DRAFT_427063 [Aspergillus brunneoviolaceus CBS 621.78]
MKQTEEWKPEISTLSEQKQSVTAPAERFHPPPSSTRPQDPATSPKDAPWAPRARRRSSTAAPPPHTESDTRPRRCFVSPLGRDHRIDHRVRPRVELRIEPEDHLRQPVGDPVGVLVRCQPGRDPGPERPDVAGVVAERLRLDEGVATVAGGVLESDQAAFDDGVRYCAVGGLRLGAGPVGAGWGGGHGHCVGGGGNNNRNGLGDWALSYGTYGQVWVIRCTGGEGV